MVSEQLELKVRHDLTPQEVDELEERIYEFNVSRTGLDDAAPIGFTLHSDDRLIGAAAGFTWGGMCQLSQMWIDQTHRRAGLGRKLLIEFIEEARRRRCTDIYLSTYDFQAPGFYLRFGFRTLAVIKDRPAGHLDTIMCLTLASTAERQ